jgi:hypothetical protein
MVILSIVPSRQRSALLGWPGAITIAYNVVQHKRCSMHGAPQPRLCALKLFCRKPLPFNRPRFVGAFFTIALYKRVAVTRRIVSRRVVPRISPAMIENLLNVDLDLSQE